jgi:hypothetical protein
VAGRADRGNTTTIGAATGRIRWVFLTVTLTGAPDVDATDLGHLLHEHPDRAQSQTMSVGTAHVFHPEATAQRCTAALLLEVDPVGLVRGRPCGDAMALGQYVNDRPYAASLRQRKRRQSGAGHGRSAPWLISIRGVLAVPGMVGGLVDNGPRSMSVNYRSLEGSVVSATEASLCWEHRRGTPARCLLQMRMLRTDTSPTSDGLVIVGRCCRTTRQPTRVGDRLGLRRLATAALARLFRRASCRARSFGWPTMASSPASTRPARPR